MRVSVFGLGYVGAVSCGCFANDGHEVVGCDINPDKVEMIGAGRAPVIEKGLEPLVQAGVESGRIRATTDPVEAVRATDASVISVGTPSLANGSLSLTAIERVCDGIGRGLAAKGERHTVIVRSTVLPGTTRSVVVPALEQSSGKCAGSEFGVCFNPEFLREGNSVEDYYNPPFTLIGALEPDDAQVVAELYARVSAEQLQTTLETAEMVKYVCNAFHALKVVFANEIGNIAKGMGVDSHEVMRIVCLDTKLNISPKYLMPGFAFGGSCLPKDLRALLYQANKELDLPTPLLAALLPSNEQQVEMLARRVLATRKRKVALLGLSFKAGTDDLRESPLVLLAERLVGKGCDLRIFDRNVAVARLVGANRAYIEHEIPHIASLMANSLDQVLEHAEVVIIGNSAPEFADVPQRCAGKQVIDLVRVAADISGLPEGYEGVCW